ncbi:MAG: hypothetical protein U0572_12585 [Phycisphaerales bacterium]
MSHRASQSGDAQETRRQRRAGTNEHVDTRTHDLANEILTRDANSDSAVDCTLTHHVASSLVDEGEGVSGQVSARARPSVGLDGQVRW